MANGTSTLILTVSLALGLAGTSLAADRSDDLERTLRTVPTITGLSAYGRIEACGIKIERSNFRQFTAVPTPSPAWFYRAFCAPPTEGSGATVTPGGGTSSSGTKKSDISGTEGSTR